MENESPSYCSAGGACSLERYLTGGIASWVDTDNDFRHRSLILQHASCLKRNRYCCSKMAPNRANISVIVVGGGGTIGSSTALHLVRSGYTPSNITVLDTYPIPSAQSAGNDLNKIMGIRLRNKVDLQLSLEARQMWTEDDLFKEYFHKTGRVSKAMIMRQIHVQG